MLVPIYTAGAAGLNTDTPDHELIPEALTFARNVRNISGQHVRTGGLGSIYQGVLFPPYHLIDVPVLELNTHYWLYMGLTNAAAIEGGVHTDVTRSAGAVPYTGTVDDKWSSTILQGIPILTNITSIRRTPNSCDPSALKPEGSSSLLLRTSS